MVFVEHGSRCPLTGAMLSVRVREEEGNACEASYQLGAAV
jgi:hypothetical protein